MGFKNDKSLQLFNLTLRGNTTFATVSPLALGTGQHHKGGWISALETEDSPQSVCAFSWPVSFTLAAFSGGRNEVSRGMGHPEWGRPLTLSQNCAAATCSALQKH